MRPLTSLPERLELIIRDLDHKSWSASLVAEDDPVQMQNKDEPAAL